MHELRGINPQCTKMWECWQSWHKWGTMYSWTLSAFSNLKKSSGGLLSSVTEEYWRTSLMRCKHWHVLSLYNLGLSHFSVTYVHMYVLAPLTTLCIPQIKPHSNFSQNSVYYNRGKQFPIPYFLVICAICWKKQTWEFLEKSWVRPHLWWLYN